MNKKLPEVYHNTENIFSNNKNTYISFNEEKKESPIHEINEINTYTNFFKYFNKHVKITTTDNKVLETKILSKLDNKILLENGETLEIEKIKLIN